MKKLLLICLLAPLAGMAQICTQKKDSNTGGLARIGITILTDSAGKENGVISLAKEGSQASLTTGRSFETFKVHHKDEGQLVLLATFDDGSTKSFTAGKHSTLMHLPNGVAVVFVANITPDDVAWIGSHAMVSETFYYADDQTNTLAFKLTTAESESVMKSVKCLEP